ncbi:MAG: enoyl-CoA hydratase/isomerase family protein [Chloroflexi bacterium]|nr:enoyl-CoA hydratase/isomerase family protein [Chloroflexota bacterium]
MKYSTVIYEKQGRIARITLNRPEVLNALNPQLFRDLRAALKEIAADKSVGVVVLTGAGRAFSAGADIKDISGGTQAEQVDLLRRLALGVTAAIEELDKPVIAAVKGYCFTGALEIATACDLVIAAESATFGDTHARWGLTPTWGGTQRLPRLIGPLKAKEMTFTCDTITATEAQRLGLINRVVPDAKLEEAVEELANKILANSPASIRIQKSLMNRGLRMDYASAQKMAEEESPGITEDSEARLKSFMDKSWDKDSARKAK